MSYVRWMQKDVESGVCVDRRGHGVGVPGQQAGEADRLEACQSTMLGSQVLT